MFSFYIYPYKKIPCLILQNTQTALPEICGAMAGQHSKPLYDNFLHQKSARY